MDGQATGRIGFTVIRFTDNVYAPRCFADGAFAARRLGVHRYLDYGNFIRVSRYRVTRYRANAFRHRQY